MKPLMNRKPLSIAACVGTLLLLTALPGSAHDNHWDRAEEGLADIERNRVQALVDGNMELAERLHAKDFQLINPGGGAMSKEDYLGGLASGFLDYLVWQPGEISVRRNGATAVLRYQSQIQIVIAGQVQPLLRFWHTDYYEKRKGRWQVVWSQATQIQS
jgi:hypothetical protein